MLKMFFNPQISLPIRPQLPEKLLHVSRLYLPRVSNCSGVSLTLHNLSLLSTSCRYSLGQLKADLPGRWAHPPTLFPISRHLEECHRMPSCMRNLWYTPMHWFYRLVVLLLLPHRAAATTVRWSKNSNISSWLLRKYWEFISLMRHSSGAAK